MAYGKNNLAAGGLSRGVATTNTPATAYTELLISHSGSGTIVSLKHGSTAKILLEIDGVDFGQISLIQDNRLDIPFKTGYKIYGQTTGETAIVAHQNLDKTVEFLTVNVSTGSVASLSLSDTGVGIIKGLDIGNSFKLIVDEITIADIASNLGGTFNTIDIPYFKSFEYYSGLGRIFYNKIS